MAVVATLSKGYDLDYIWKQVDRGLVKDADGYYLQASQVGGELKSADLAIYASSAGNCPLAGSG